MEVSNQPSNRFGLEALQVYIMVGWLVGSLVGLKMCFLWHFTFFVPKTKNPKCSWGLVGRSSDAVDS